MRIVNSLFVSLVCLASCSNDKSLLWEVSGNGLKEPSYLYGTMHTADQRVFDFKPAVKKAFEESQKLALELNIDSIDQMALLKGLVMDSTSLDQLLSVENYQLVETYFHDSLGMPLSIYNKMQPMFTATLASTKGLGSEMEDALDLYFYKEAKKSNKRIIGLEKLDEQINAFRSIPVTKQAEELVDVVRSQYDATKKKSDELKTMLDYYLKGDVEKMARMAAETEYNDPALSELFNTMFIVNRNQNMADRSVPLMQEGRTFIAVGAAHLGGDSGLIQLLRDKGYTVQPK